MAWHSGKPADDDFLSASVQHIRENFAELEPLQPHVAALLNSRIVDHNLDVATPPNGYYVRWANKLQMCWHNLRLNFISSRRIDAVWTYPATFSGSRRPTVFAQPMITDANGIIDFNLSDPDTFLDVAQCVFPGAPGLSSVLVAIYRVPGSFNFASGNYARAEVVALGVW